MSATLDARDVPTAPPGAAATARPRRKLLRPILMLGGVAAVVAGSLGFWITGGRTVSIDNAYIRADKLSLATDVSGLVAEVPVREGQVVKRGDVLFRLDDRQFRIAVVVAESNLEQVRLQLVALQRDYERMQRDISTKQATVSMDQARFDRANGLIGRGDISRQTFDDARFQLLADQQASESAKVAAEVALARLGGDIHAAVTTLPAYRQADAQLDEAKRQLEHTVVRAPMAGVVTGVSALQPGVYLAASTAAFGLVSTENVWVEANPKETELTWVRPGDKVSVTVDTYPGHVWSGTVESIAPSSGSEFSILPAQNSSGNWVKVVQRIPLRVRIENPQSDLPLRSGMSVETEIDTGHVRSWGELL
jgi:membrane fusion protein (multidrug efflux system)